MRAALALADARGRFLYELRPDLFPEGHLTPLEELLWARFYEERARAEKAARR
ncbi:MAG: hypothetical protein RJA36_1301 [Pseudomonadota bacterium]